MSLSDFIKIPWNKYEAVILVDAYQRCVAGEMSKSNAVSQVSKRLRAHLINMGLPVSDAYRNESGISLQMSAIEYLFTDGKTGISHVSTLFQDTVALFKENRELYDILLGVANVKYPIEDQFSTSDFVTGYASETDSAQLSVLEDISQSKYVSKKLYDLLAKKFPKGYKLGSYMEVSRLKKFYYDEYCEELDMEGDDIDKDVKACGIEHDGRVYIPDTMLSSNLKERILSSVNNFFAKGGSCLFYSVLFKMYQDELLDTHILNSEMLMEYLKYTDNSGLFFYPQYCAKIENATVDILQEVVDFVKAQGGSVSEDEVVVGLSFFPEDQVRMAFDDRNTNLISCRRNLRFHMDNFVASKEELTVVEDIIRQAISSYKYITFSELLEDIKTQVPSILENNAVFSEIGIRNALSILLGPKFSFRNSLISSHNHPIKAEDAFKELAKRPPYTIDDVNSLAEACGTLSSMYIEQLLQNSVRVDKTRFVPLDTVNFDVDGIDNMLLRLCTGNYIALSEVTTLSALPTCNYQWTPFLLESYVGYHSKVFKLMHAKYFGQKHVTGALVKRGCQIRDFNTLAATAVIDAGVPLKQNSVLDFLCEKQYIVQHRYEDIDTVLSIAHQLNTKKK